MVAREHSKNASPVEGRILVMEEEEYLRNLIERIMTQKGFQALLTFKYEGRLYVA